MMKSNLSRRFQDLLLNFSQAEELDVRNVVEGKLWQEFGEEHAVFVLDMSGFSLLTRKYGIVHYLSMVKRMQLTTEPIIDSFGGSLVKYEADNCFALFPSPLSAINAAVAIQHAFRTSNMLTSDDLDIYVSCGIDYGKILVVDNNECFGDAVNRASKLGEDVASAGEILVTKEAIEMLPPKTEIKASEMTISISGINIQAHAIEY